MIDKIKFCVIIHITKFKESIMSKELWAVLVPTVRNDGRPYKLRYHRVWDNKVRELTGGLTVMPPAKGQWVNADGVLFEERMIPVYIAATRDIIEKIIDMTIKFYQQEAVMAYMVSPEVIIKYA